MQFTPQTEDEVMADQLCPKGKAPFTVLEASIKQVKNGPNQGKEMLALKLNVHADGGFDWHIYDNVMPWVMAFKFRHFFFAVNRGSYYESGSIEPSNLVGAQGWCEVVHKKDKQSGELRAAIGDYVMDAMPPAQTPSAKAKAKAAAEKPAIDDSDIPF